MKKNMGAVDRGVRIALTVVVVMLFFTDRISGILAIILGIVALAFFITSLIGYCPAYLPLGFKTFRDNNKSVSGNED